MAAILRTVLTMTLLHYAASDDADHKTTTNPTDAAAMAASSCFKCPKDETGPDTCGSCTFTAGNFCNWTNSRHAEYLWKPDVSIQGRNKWIKVASDMTGNHKAVLTSPVMCHLRGDVICLMFRYSFTIWDKGMLTVQVCHTNCRDIFVAFTSSSGSRSTWHNQSVEFIAEGNLRVLFIGNKSEDGIGYEADAYLDYIVYRREPCYNSSNRVSTTTAVATDPTTVWPDEGDSGKKTPNDTAEQTMATVNIAVPMVVVLLLVTVGTAVVIVLVWRRRREKFHMYAGGTQ